MYCADGHRGSSDAEIIGFLTEAALDSRYQLASGQTGEMWQCLLDGSSVSLSGVLPICPSTQVNRREASSEALTGLPMFLSNSAPENVMPPLCWLACIPLSDAFLNGRPAAR